MTIYTDNLLKRICFLNQKFSRVDRFLKRHLGETNLICRSTRPTDLILVKPKNNITKFWFLVFYFYHQNIFVFFTSCFQFIIFLFSDTTCNNQNQGGFIICQKQPLEVFRRKKGVLKGF